MADRNGSPRRAPPHRFACALLPVLTMLGMGGMPCASAGPWEVGSTTVSRHAKLKLEWSWKGTTQHQSGDQPKLKFAAPLRSNLSFEVAAGRGRNAPRGEAVRHGGEDLSGKLKWSLQRESERGFDLLVEPKLSLATGSRAAGTGGKATTLKVPLRIGKHFGAVHLTGEVRYTHGLAAGYTDLVGYGGLVEYQWAPRWTVGVDVFNDRPTHAGNRNHWRTEAAFKFKPGSRWEWEGLVGRSIDNQRGLPTTTVKLEAACVF